MNLSSIIKAQCIHYLKLSFHKNVLRSHRNKQCLRHNVIFVHVPKCAGTSFLESLFGQQSGLGHKSAFQYMCIYGLNEYMAAFKFGFVRNPYDRLVSAYEYLSHGGNNSSDTEFYNRHLSNYESFEAFVLKGLAQDSHIQNHVHFRPQSHFLCIDGKIAVDFVGRYENLEKDFAYIARMLGQTGSLTKTNTSRKAKTFDQYYGNPLVKSAVQKYYQADFSNFNYAVELNPP